MEFVDSCLNVSDCLARVQMLRAGSGTVHNGVTTVQLETVIQKLQPFCGCVITRILNPAVSLPHKVDFRDSNDH